MTQENKTSDPAGSTPGQTTSSEGENTRRIRIVREISELVLIPEIELLIYKTLEEAKKKYEGKIAAFKNLKQDLEKEFSTDEGGKTGSKSFYFELNRVEDKDIKMGYKWDWGEFKLKPYENMVAVIFSKFIESIDKYKIAPNLVQVETVYSPLDKWFQFDFTKNSDSRVVGYVKMIDEKFVVKETPTILTVNNRTHKSLQKERVIQLMEENPRFWEYISFYAGLILQTTGSTTL